MNMGVVWKIPNKIKERSIEFYSNLLTNPLFLLIAVIYIFGKITTNFVMGASWINALRSSIFGFIIYFLACYFIHLISDVTYAQEEHEHSKRLRDLLFWIIGWLILAEFLIIMNVMNTYHITDFRIPVWGQLVKSWSSFVKETADNSKFVEGTGLIGWPNLLLYVLIPVLILWKFKFRFPKFFGLKTSAAAFPFLVIYTIGYIVIKGISATNLLTLLFVLIWPALGEEFLYRGVIQGTLMKTTVNPVTAISITSLLFTISHIPVYFFGYYNEPVMALSGLLPILLTSFLWGYGYYRTAVLWPWVLIHALSNLVAF